MKCVQQFRYYGEGHPSNYPSDSMNSNSLYDGSIFKEYTPITQIGIQSLPGTTFYLNNDETRSNPIIIGYSGIFELDLDGITEINTLCFQLESLQRINQVYGASLIIDIIYEGEI